MKPEKCITCGRALSETNIRLALEEARVSRDEIAFACPSYDPIEDTCPPVALGDSELPAMWREADEEEGELASRG